jgi:hypothetical protein
MLHDDARMRANDEVAPAGRIEADGLTRRFADTTMLNGTYGRGEALVNWSYDYEAPLPTPVDCR